MIIAKHAVEFGEPRIGGGVTKIAVHKETPEFGVMKVGEIVRQKGKIGVFIGDVSFSKPIGPFEWLSEAQAFCRGYFFNRN